MASGGGGEQPFIATMRSSHLEYVHAKRAWQACANSPLDPMDRLMPPKPSANVHPHVMHTTRRAEVLSQDVFDRGALAKPLSPRHAYEHCRYQERVFQHTSRKPIETSVTLPHEFASGQNTLATFCLRNNPNEQSRRVVLENFKRLNRDLTRAFNRQAS